MMLVLPIILPAILGYLLASSLLSSDRHVSVMERVALAYPLGIGMLTIQMFFLGLAGIPLTRASTVSLLALEILALSIWAGRRRIDLLGERSVEPMDMLQKDAEPLHHRIFSLLLLVWISLKVATVFLETYLRPIYAFDSFVNWSVRAKVFFYSNSLLLNPSAHDFFGRGINHSSANYPPINPLAQMWMALWLGRFDEVLVKFWTPLFLVCAVIYLYIVAARETNRLIALVIVTVFVSSPLVSIHATETLSDLPLSVYFLFALSSLQNVIRGRWGYLPLVGLFAACAVLLKGEGSFIAIPLFVSSCYIVWRETGDGKQSMRSLLVPLVLPYLLIVPWLVFKSIYKLGYGVDEIYLTLVFRPIMILDYLRLIIGLQNFNVVFLFMPVLLLLHGRFDKELAVLVATVGFYVMFFLSLYLFVAYYTDNQRFSEGVFRNTLTYYPATILIMILLIRRLLPQGNNDPVEHDS